MIKNYTEPKNKAIWAKYQPLVRILFVCGILASIYSGITEYYKFYSTFDIPNRFSRMTAALSLTLLIELALRGFSRMLFETIFEKVEPNVDSENTEDIDDVPTEKGRPLMIVFLAIAVLVVGYVSTSNSLDGKTIYIDDTTAPPDTVQHDDTPAKLMEEEATHQFEADSLNAIAEVKSEIVKERQSLEKAQSEAVKSINWLKKQGTYDSETAAPYWSAYAQAKKSLKRLPGKEKEQIQVSLAVAKAKYNVALSAAKDTLQGAYATAISQNSAIIKGFLQSKSVARFPGCRRGHPHRRF